MVRDGEEKEQLCCFQDPAHNVSYGMEGMGELQSELLPALMRKCFVFTEKLFYLLWPFTCSWVASVGVFGWYKGSSSEPGVPVPPGQRPDPALGLSPSQGAAWSLRDHRGL